MKVTYVDHMGTDLSVVNAARVSFGKVSKELSEADERLIHFLARGCTYGDWDNLLAQIEERAGTAMWNGDKFARTDMERLVKYVKNMPDHWTPFGHTAITLHIKAPIFVARQLGKHQVGFVWNEVSRRYVTDTPEFFVPEVWRKAAENVKQGSSNEVVTDLRFQGFGVQTVHDAYYKQQLHSLDLYKDMLEAGVCPEQARMVLPQSMYTEWYWTGNLYSFANVYVQRTDNHAQKEVQQVAHQIGDIIRPLFPVSWEALTQ